MPLRLLMDELARELRQPLPAGMPSLVEALRQRHGSAVAAVLFYGSCLRSGVLDGRIADFYVLVDRYHEAYRRRLPALLNALLPPNVYYLEAAYEGRRLRAKYAVVSLRDFARGASRRARSVSIWARFAQPAALAYVRDPGVEARIVEALATAVETLLDETLPLLPAQCPAQDLWTRAFTETYRSELRAERPGRAAALYRAFPARYDRLAAAVRADAGGTGARPAWRAGLHWWWRRRSGKVLSVLRLAKAAFTFEDGLDYIVWKIEQHSGVRTAVTPWQRRHPLLAASLLFWRLYRRGAFR